MQPSLTKACQIAKARKNRRQAPRWIRAQGKYVPILCDATK